MTKYIIRKDYTPTDPNNALNLVTQSWAHGVSDVITQICVDGEPAQWMLDWIKQYGFTSVSAAQKWLEAQQQAAEYETSEGIWTAKVTLVMVVNL